MKHVLIAGALALASVSVAGMVAATHSVQTNDCEHGTLPTGGFYNVCLFNEYATSSSGCSWTGCFSNSQKVNNPVNVNAGQSAFPLGGASVYADVRQFEQSSSSSNLFGNSQSSSSGTSASASQSASAGVGTSGGVSVFNGKSAYRSCSSFGCFSGQSEGTSISTGRTVGTPFGFFLVSAGYSQNDSGAGCRESSSATVAGTGIGWNTVPVIPNQACTHDIPNLQDSGVLFPDWPDNTGLPFL